jgi:hypothetical protein
MDASLQAGTVTRKPLFQALHDGSAGAGVRLLISLAGALLLLAAASAGAFVLGYLFPPPWVRAPGSGYPPGGVYVRDEIAAFCYISAGAAYLAFLFWLWSRHRRNRAIWLGAAMTVGIWLIAIALSVLIDALFTGEDEFLIAGVICAAAGLTLLGWIRLYYRYVGGRPLYDESGVIDIRCPACQYRMVGLKQSRCPECGREYTLDELVGKQDFEVLRLRRTLIGPRGQPAEAPGDRLEGQQPEG